METTGMLPFYCFMTAAGLALLIPGIIKSYRNYDRLNPSSGALCFLSCLMFYPGLSGLILYFAQDITVQIFGMNTILGNIILAVLALILLSLTIIGGIKGIHINLCVNWFFGFLVNAGAILQAHNGFFR